MKGNGANVDLTVISVVADAHDITDWKDHRVALGYIRCRATNSHESYEWTTTVAEAPRIGDTVHIRPGGPL